MLFRPGTVPVCVLVLSLCYIHSWQTFLLHVISCSLSGFIKLLRSVDCFTMLMNLCNADVAVLATPNSSLLDIESAAVDQHHQVSFA